MKQADHLRRYVALPEGANALFARDQPYRLDQALQADIDVDDYNQYPTLHHKAINIISG